MKKELPQKVKSISYSEFSTCDNVVPAKPELIKLHSQKGLCYDQLIMPLGTWLHLQAINRQLTSEETRYFKQFLIIPEPKQPPLQSKLGRLKKKESSFRTKIKMVVKKSVVLIGFIQDIFKRSQNYKCVASTFKYF